MNWYKRSQEESEDFEFEEDDLSYQLLDENNWKYLARGSGLWSFGDYLIDPDTPLETFDVTYKDGFLGSEEDLEKAMQLASDHASGYAEVQESKQEVTPYQKIEQLYGYTNRPESAGYIMSDGQMVNLNRPHIDHREVTMDGSTKSMIEFIADGNIRLGFQNGYAFIDIRSEPTGSQRSVLKRILSESYDGADIHLSVGLGPYNEHREAYDTPDQYDHEQFSAGTSGQSMMGFITNFYENAKGNKVYPSQFGKFLSQQEQNLVNGN